MKNVYKMTRCLHSIFTSYKTHIMRNINHTNKQKNLTKGEKFENPIIIVDNVYIYTIL